MTRLILCLALFAVAAQGQEQRDLERLWKMDKLAKDSRQGIIIEPYSFDTYTFADGEKVMRYIFGRDTVYGRGAVDALEAIGVKAILSLYAQYEDDCRRDTVVNWNGRCWVSHNGKVWFDAERRASYAYPYVRPMFRPRITPNGLDSNFLNWLRKRK